MVFGEHPDKVANIVTKSMPHFHRLYAPIIDVSSPSSVARRGALARAQR